MNDQPFHYFFLTLSVFPSHLRVGMLMARFGLLMKTPEKFCFWAEMTTLFLKKCLAQKENSLNYHHKK